MKQPQNIACTKTYYNSCLAIENSMQRQQKEIIGLSILGFSRAYSLSSLLVKIESVPCCCIFDFSTSTKHCVVQGSGQDQGLVVGQGMRIATEQKGQTYTNLGFCDLSSEAVQNVIFQLFHLNYSEDYFASYTEFISASTFPFSWNTTTTYITPNRKKQ